MPQLDLFIARQSSTKGIDIEFKSARVGMPGSFWGSYAAIANTQGDTIMLGEVEKASGLVWEGVPDAAQLRKVLWSQLNDRHKISANLPRDEDVGFNEISATLFCLSLGDLRAGHRYAESQRLACSPTGGMFS